MPRTESPVRELRLALTVERYAEAVAEPVVTPWRHRNVRLRAPDGMQLTLFTVLGDEGDAGATG